MAEQWYYMRGGQRVGPMSIEEIRQAAQRGDLTPQSYVWNEQMTNWTPAGDVGGLLGGPGASPSTPAQAQVAYASAQETAPGATAALVLGIIGFCLCPIVCGILAIVFGNSALTKIRENPGRFQGEGIAKAGLILGVVQLILFVLGLLLNILGYIGS
jgi:hypothetical protein